MEAKELIKKVRRIEIKTKGLSSQLFSGEYHSAFKGRGMTFSEVRDYAAGDEIRTIDWNVTARFNEPYVKVFEEERETTVMLLIDMSASVRFGTQEQLKLELITELAGVLSFSAIKNNDKCGLILFTDKVEKYIPPKKGKSHILRMIREILEFESDSVGTNIGSALQYFARTVKKKSIAFVISDFIGGGYAEPLMIARRKHDIIGVQIKDKRENELPKVGWINQVNPETGQTDWINTNNKKTRLTYKQSGENFQSQLTHFFKKAGIDHCVLETGEDYIYPLMNLFKRR